MIIWVNGAFGVGKTTLTRELLDRHPEFVAFDPEGVGELLQQSIGARVVVRDFQDWPPWRDLVPRAAAGIADTTGSTLVAPQTVVVREYWLELMQGFAELGHEVFHIVLDADEETLSARIAGSGEAVEWRQERLADYLSAREWLREEADLVLDTTSASPAELAEQVEAALSDKAAHLRTTADMRKAPRWREQRGRSYTPRDLNPEPTD